MVFYRYEWTDIHTERKAVISLYAPEKVEMEHLNEFEEPIMML